MLTIVGSVIAYQLTDALSKSRSWAIVGAWMAVGIVVTYLLYQLQARSQKESPEAIKESIKELRGKLREEVQKRSFGTRWKLIEEPLYELDLDMTPRTELVRDPKAAKYEPPKKITDIVIAFKSSKRRLLIVGEPGSGKTIAAYSLIEYLDKNEVRQDEGETGGVTGRVPLLVNLSAWEGQENFEAFLVDYLCSSVGYQVRQRSVAEAFIASRQYSLILDGLDEIPARLRQHFSERLDEIMQGLPREVGVVVTCRTQEYEQLLAGNFTGLGLVQAVEILPLTEQQLDSAFIELANRDKEWEPFLSQRHHTAYKRVRDLLSTPLFLNLAVVGHLSPSQLLDWTTTEQELRTLVLGSYLDHTLANHREYEPEGARRYLTWIARFLNGAEVSPFGCKARDYSVFDLADLTPPEPARGYRLAAALISGLVNMPLGPIVGLVFGLFWFKRSALSSRLTFVWPSTQRQRRDFLRKVGWGLLWGILGGLPLGLLWGIIFGRILGLVGGAVFGLLLWVVVGLFWGLSETRPVLIAYRTPKEARSRSLISALLYMLITSLLFGLVWGITVALIVGLEEGLVAALVFGPLYTLIFMWFFGVTVGIFLGLNNGGWFVVLQKLAHRRLARAGNLPSPPYDFLEWGLEQQIFRRVGGGVRFRHSLIQQHLAKGSEGTNLS